MAPTTPTRMDRKLANIRAGRYTRSDFIIADAKDGDMAPGTGTSGPEFDAECRPTGRMRPLQVDRDNEETMIASSTTRDTLEMVIQAGRHGAHVALFGRRISFAEDSVGIVRATRRVIKDGISSEGATRAYHDDLGKAGIRSKKTLVEEIEITDPWLKAV